MNNKDNLNISLLVGLKNNLEYSQFFYETTRSLYPNAEIVFVSYGSTDDTHNWLDSLSDDNLIYFYSPETKTLSDTYNKCSELATKDYIILLHNDMILTPNFLENVLKYINDKTIVGYSFIEPPIYADDKRVGKIIHDFKADIDNFPLDRLYSLSEDLQKEHQNKYAERIDLKFFLSMKNKILKSIGGFDNLFNPMFFEDDDLFLRLEQVNLKMITSLDAICYHFVSKTSRFSEDVVKRTKQIENNSQRNFIRKWGFTSYNEKRNTKNIGIIIKKVSLNLLREIEPYASKIYVDSDFSEYIKEEQPKTKFDLRARIFPITSLGDHDIIIEVDGEKIDDASLEFIKNIYRNIDKRRKSFFKSLFLGKNKINKKGITVRIYNYN